MKLYEHKIIVLISKLKPHELVSFFNSASGIFIFRHQDVLEWGLSNIFQQAAISNNEKMRKAVRDCFKAIMKLETAQFQAYLDNIMTDIK